MQTVQGVRKLMAQMKQRFPGDMDYAISLDQTASVTEGMKEILVTLLIAIVLVILVVYLFLQDWRATLIPLLAVPVSLVGTFVLFPLFGFSINTLSLFGLVLAIGLVVDDAIVVVEGVQRHIEEGLNPKDAARKAMEELTWPGDWYRLGSLFGLCAHSVYSGNHWKALSAIRRDHRHLRCAVRLQCTDAQPGAGRAPAAAKEREPWTFAAFLQLVQSPVRTRYGRLRPLVRRAPSQGCNGAGAAGDLRRGRIVLWQPSTVQLPAR